MSGTRGISNCKDFIRPKEGDRWRFRDRSAPNPYKQEHEDLITSIRAGNPINEARAFAESTMTGIIGREAAYSGKAGGTLLALSAADGKELARYKLDSAPAWDSISVAGGQLYITLTDGTLQCMGE